MMNIIVHLIRIKFLLSLCLVMKLFLLIPIFLSTFIKVMKYMQVNNVRPRREVAMCSLFEDVQNCGTTYCPISSTSLSKFYYILNFLLLEIGTLCHVLETINTCNAHVQLHAIHAKWKFLSFKPPSLSIILYKFFVMIMESWGNGIS